MVYLDYNSTTPVDARVIDAMMPMFSERFGNPSSTTHESGLAAMDMVDVARDQVSSILGRKASDVVFTSGATEANNLVMFGLGMNLDRSHEVLVGSTEHKSVLETGRHLETLGLEMKTVPVTADGVTDVGALDDMMNHEVDLVSIMAANSETGVIQPTDTISKIVHDYGALLHCDATQAIGKIPFNAYDLDVDIVTLSSHKIYGPKGCGAIVATKDARRQLMPMIRGGGQENGMRSGTLNVPGIVGFGRACDIAVSEGLKDAPRQRALRDDLEAQMASTVEGVTVNGGGAERLPNTSNMRIEGALADAVIVNLPTVEISTGSACSSAAMEPSHVLLAMGLDRTAADESVRVSLGRPTTNFDIDLAVSELARGIAYVRGKEAEIQNRRMA